MAFPYWLNVNPTSGTGPGSSTITVSPNTGRSRSYMLTINGTVDGKPSTSTAMVSQTGTYRAIDNVVIKGDGSTINANITTNGDGSTLYEITGSEWNSKNVFAVELKSNAAVYSVKLLPSTAGATFHTGVSGTITYINNSGLSVTTSLGLTSTTTAIDTRNILPSDFDPGINGDYTIKFGVAPNKSYTNSTTKDVFCGVGLYALEEFNGVTGTPTLIAQVGTTYPGVIGVTPSFPGGGSVLNASEVGTTSTLDIDCADTSTWTIQ